MKNESKAVLYVWGRKQLATSSTFDPSQGVGPDSGADVAPSTYMRAAIFTDGGRGGPHSYRVQWTLPEPQAHVVSVVRGVAAETAIDLEVIDLGQRRHWALRKKAKEQGWREFPVLVGPGGQSLIGSEEFTVQKVRDALLREPLAGR